LKSLVLFLYVGLAGCAHIPVNFDKTITYADVRADMIAADGIGCENRYALEAPSDRDDCRPFKAGQKVSVRGRTVDEGYFLVQPALTFSHYWVPASMLTLRPKS
jgi:hypothetical protein